VWRVYKAAGLSVKRTHRKKLIRSLRPALQLHAANQEWAIDFVSDVLHAGRSFRVLSVVDSFTRECLALKVDASMGSQRVTRALDRIIQPRGLPLAIRSDNVLNARGFFNRDTARAGTARGAVYLRTRDFKY
jgi:putative transposase